VWPDIQSPREHDFTRQIVFLCENEVPRNTGLFARNSQARVPLAVFKHKALHGLHWVIQVLARYANDPIDGYRSHFPEVYKFQGNSASLWTLM
jgi:hypothetical protein